MSAFTTVDELPAIGEQENVTKIGFKRTAWASEASSLKKVEIMQVMNAVTMASNGDQTTNPTRSKKSKFQSTRKKKKLQPLNFEKKFDFMKRKKSKNLKKNRDF